MERSQIGWQAKAPAPLKRKPSRIKVGQTLSSVNPAARRIFPQLLMERLLQTKTKPGLASLGAANRSSEKTAPSLSRLREMHLSASQSDILLVLFTLLLR
jgi:hypothetical protein